jgi:hypothetical protein
MEGSAPSKRDEDTIRVFSIRGARNVGAPATQNSHAPSTEKKFWMMVIHRQAIRDEQGGSNVK